MRKIRLLLKIVAFSLAVIIIIQILPLSILATEINNNEVIEQAASESAVEDSPEIIGEVESLRDEYTKHFRCEDGSFIAAMYNEPIHYQENGEWKEIDNTLQINSITAETLAVSGTQYAVTATSTPVSFPENISNGKVTISKNDNVIAFSAKTNINEAESATLLAPEELISTSIAETADSELIETMEESDIALDANIRSSAITYNNVFENASLEYEISSSMIKESIVIFEKSDSYIFEFSIDFGDFIPIENTNGGIYIYETAQSEEPIMAIAPPYMFDADNDFSDEVTMALIANETDYTLVIEADESWINSIFRSFPVVIDPTFILDVGRKNIDDIHVNQNMPNTSYKLDYQIEVGRSGDNVYRSYIKYILPALPDCSVVTNAELKLIQNWARSFDTTELYLNVYQCEKDWDFDSITWNNQPIQNLSEATIVDYTNYEGGMSAEYNLNITKIVKNWYENGENYGLMLASSDESVEEKTSFYSSRNILSNYPVVEIQYINNTGIEDYWTYEGFSLGDSGSAYINTYNGALTYVHGDVSTSGLVAPLSISHFYNTEERNAAGSFNNMKFGKGFKLSLVEKIEATDSALISDYPYKYIDADGTVHFFKKGSSSNQFYYEFGSDIVLTLNGSWFTMSSPDGSEKEFNSDGYLTKTTDKNGNSTTITYIGGKITKVTDGSGLSVSLSYNSDNTLSSITDAAGRNTNYYYTTAGYLERIEYPDGTQTSYEYSSENSLLNKIAAYNGAQATLTYKDVTCPGKTFYRVSSFSTYGEDAAHTLYDTITFEYRTNDTVLKSEKKKDEVVLAFDNAGRVVNAIENDESISVAQYHNSGNTKNKAEYVSNVFTPKENLAKRGSGYYRYETTVTNRNYVSYSNSCQEKVFNQDKSFKLSIDSRAGEGSSYFYTGVRSGTGFDVYTISAYVNIVDTMGAGSVYMTVVTKDENDVVLGEYKSEELTTTNNEWKRLSVTIDVPEEVYNIIVSYGIFDGNGTVYLENVYAEGSNVANRMNLVCNSSFETKYPSMPPTHWGGTGGNAAMNGFTENPSDGSCAVWLLGDPSREAYFSQYIYMNGKQGDVLIFGASAQALCSASGNNGKRFFGLKIQFLSGVNVLQEERFCFNEDAYGTMQTIMNKVVAEQDYNLVKIFLCYDYEINTVIYDNVFLYRDSFGVDYSYDSQGRIASVSDDNGRQINYTRANSVDVTGITALSNGMVTQSASYSYDTQHNLISAVGLDGVKTTYTYPETDNKGLPLSVTVSDESGQNTSTTSYSYYDYYRYIRSVTDPTGATTFYEYDTSKGLLTAVIDPKGNVTEYEYDPNNDLLLSTSNPSDALGRPKTEYEYDTGKRLMGISNGELSYFMYYDQFGRLEVAETSRTTCFRVNEYDENGNITLKAYGLENEGNFCYDEDGRLTSETYDGVLAYEYAYTDDGGVGRVVDHENDVSWNYQYDLAGRVTSVSSSDSRNINYTYNDKNEVSRFKVSQMNSDMLETAYTYDSSGRAVGAQVLSMDGQPQQIYSYDTLGRTQSFSSVYDSENVDNSVSYNYSYKVNGSNQTGLVDTISYKKTTASGVESLLPQLRYYYDANGNITHLFENDVLTVKYYYDGLNRLVREDNAQIGKTVVYKYDKEGDINSKVEYSLTFAEEPGDPVDTIAYEYKNFNWPNAVTKYDSGEIITYDGLGNPTTYNGYSLIWTKSRQLTAMSDTRQTLSFKYDSSGIRTKKRFNGVETYYTYVGGTLVSQRTGDEVISFSYTAGGAPYGFTYNGTSYFYLLNLQGDIIGIYDSTGTVVVKYVYDSWGKLISITGSLADTIGVKNPLRYRGYYYDTEIGWYYLQSRYYDPETCRFINADAYFVAGNDYIQGTNMFAYCYNNPVMYVDPTGYESNEFLVQGFAVIFGSIFLAAILAETVPYDQAVDIISYIGSLDLSADGFIDMINLILSDIADGDGVYSISGGGSVPPDHPDFKPPKGGNHKKKNPNGSGYGWEAKDGGVWVWTPGMHGGEGWTVQYPGGKHKHAYPGGGTRNHFSLDDSLVSSALIGVGALATVVLLADNITGAGAFDDALIPVIWSAVLA